MPHGKFEINISDRKIISMFLVTINVKQLTDLIKYVIMFMHILIKTNLIMSIYRGYSHKGLHVNCFLISLCYSNTQKAKKVTK